MISRNPFLKFITLCLIIVILNGCAGRAANPVMVQQYGDENKSCKALNSEMQFVQSEITRLIPQTNKTGKNVLLGVTGWFFIVPWFFMDLSKAEQEEINALRHRYNHLAIIATDKCSEAIDQIPDFKDRKAFEAYQKKQQEKLGLATPAPTDQDMTLEEAKAKVRELEAKQKS